MTARNRSQYPLHVTGIPKQKPVRVARYIAGVGIFAIVGLFLIPKIVTVEVLNEQSKPVSVAEATPFPVSVDTTSKSIVQNPAADALFANHASDLSATVGNVSYIIGWIAATISNTAAYQTLASADGHIVTVKPGYRSEEVMSQLSSALNWNKSQQQEFLTDVEAQTPGLTDGIFAPGTYVVDTTMTPANVAALMNLGFSKTILLHYGTSTAEHVPLNEALTVASLLEREAAGPTDMREISGIIWNRLFSGMNLQIDATLQYAKGENSKGNWWQAVVPKDKYIKSAYNTYQHAGLPPGPIASPSLAAVLAALNPVDTDCVFYFHDKNGQFHCTKTYAEHVALLKKYYGQGK